MIHITPKEREAGKKSFLAAAAGDPSRRDFLKQAALAGVVAGGGVGAFYFGYEKTLSDPVRVAVLGTGDEGSVLIGAINPNFVEVKAIADIRPYNVYRAFEGDCYSPDALAARPGLVAKYGWNSRSEAEKHVAVYKDYRELLEKEKDNIEAVIIALPLHLHAPAAIAAMEAGLHVLTEKLMGHTIGDCKKMARVAKKTGLYLATGHQRRYNILYQEAMDTIQRGVLGDLHYIRAQWHRGNLPGSDSWAMPLPPGVKDPKKYKDADKLLEELNKWKEKLSGAIKAGNLSEVLDWQKKVQQKQAQIADEQIKDKAKDFGYEDRQIRQIDGSTYDRPAIEELIRWRLWDRTGAGLMAELGSHQMDAASIFISAMHEGKKQYPLNVVAAGNRPLFPADRDVEDHVCCILEFPAPGYDPKDPIARRKKIGVQYASINGNGFEGYGEVVFGTKGTLVLEREKDVMLFRGPSESKVGAGRGAGPALDTQASGAAQKAEAKQAADVSRGYAEEIEHWAWCIRNPAPENQPRCLPKVALADAVIALTTNLAARKGIRVEFKKEWFDPEKPDTPEDDLKNQAAAPAKA
jgi:predicted dehydrogenase